MKYGRITLIFTFSLTILRLLFTAILPLTGDEAYYWQWSRHLDLCYYEQGPILALVIWIFTIFGKITTVFNIRLGSVVLSLGTMWAAWHTYLRLYGNNAKKGAMILILFMNSSLIFSLGSVLMMHDTVMVFFLSLFFLNLTYITEKAEDKKHWILAGIILAVATMSKFTAGAAYLAGLVYFLFFAPGKKNIKGLFIMSFFYLIFCAPVFYWNSLHDWASFRYLLIRSGSTAAFPLKYFLELSISQAALVSVFLLTPLILGFRNALSKKDQAGYVFALLSAFMLIPFLLLSLKSKVEANWPAFAFYPAFFLAARWADQNEKSTMENILKFALPGLIIALIIHLQACFGLIRLPAGSDPIGKFKGYKEVAVKASEVYNKYAAQGPVFAASRHYQSTSLLSFYMAGRPMVYALLNHESSKNYRFWNGYKEMKGAKCVFFYIEPWEVYEASVLFTDRLECGEVRADGPDGRAFNYCVFSGYKGAK